MGIIIQTVATPYGRIWPFHGKFYDFQDRFIRASFILLVEMHLPVYLSSLIKEKLATNAT